MKYIEILKLEKIFGNGNENHSYFLKIEKKLEIESIFILKTNN